MDAATLLNYALMAGGAMLTFIAKLQSDKIHEMQESHQALADDHRALEVLVAGSYVKREDLEKLGNAIFKKLDVIESLLHSKQDKP